MAGTKRIVDVLKNTRKSSQHFYVVVLCPTHNVVARFAHHNAGRRPHTARHRPWQLHVTIELPDEQGLLSSSQDLKSGSGRAFARRHFRL